MKNPIQTDGFLVMTSIKRVCSQKLFDIKYLPLGGTMSENIQYDKFEASFESLELIIQNTLKTLEKLCPGSRTDCLICVHSLTPHPACKLFDVILDVKDE